MSNKLDRYFKKSKQRKGEAPEAAVEGEAPEAAVEGEAPEAAVEDPRPSHHARVKRDLWPILQETVRQMVLFPNHLAYTRKHILLKQPAITPEELAIQLDVTLGVALVILDQLHSEQRKQE